jgi:subtilisin family serine protease
VGVLSMRSNRKNLQVAIYSVLLATTASLTDEALAQDAAAETPQQTLDATFTTSNPNLTEWTLINLTSSDVTSALNGQGTKVAVLDGKADCRHVALSGRCVNYAISGGTYTTYNAHGTHVAGIVGANPYGIAPAATVLSYGVFADSGWVATGTKLSDTWKAALAAGAHISNMSFGCSRKALCFSASDLATMGNSSMTMLFVKAAGNDGSTLVNETTSASAATAQAALNKTLIVGSVNANGTLSSFSNRPGSTCLLAGGATKCSDSMLWRNHFLVAPGAAIYSTTPNGTYGSWSGTSMAAPVVAGAAALLQARWPFLKDTPETLAQILLTSATDLGDPGVDDVYGYGLLNVRAAFAASGTVTIAPIVEPAPPPPDSGTTTDTSTSTKTKPGRGNKNKGAKQRSISTGSMSGFAAAIASLPVYDEFGRDFRYDETGQLDVRSDSNRQSGIRSRRLLGAITQDTWAPAFFASEPTARSFAAVGSTSAVPGLDTPDRSIRAGVDVPFGRTTAQLRLSGSDDPRSDFSHDPSLRPLGFFHSTNIATDSLISNVLVPAGENARVMVYALTSVQPLELQYDESTRNSMSDRQRSALKAQSLREARRTHSGVGVGYWRQVSEGTIVGVNASAMKQRNGFLSLSSDLEPFEQPTNLFNLGVAVSHSSGKWDFSAATEFTHARMNATNQPIGVTPTTTVSGEVTLSRKGIIASGGNVTDSLRTSLVIPPRAISGDLKLEYLAPTEDGMSRQATVRRIAMSTLGHEPIRLESAYQISSGDRWSLSVTGGVDLEKVGGSRSAEALISFRTSL